MNGYRKLFDASKRYILQTDEIGIENDGIVDYLIVQPMIEKVRGRYQWKFVAVDIEMPAGMVFHVYPPFRQEAPKVYMVWFWDTDRELTREKLIGDASIIKEIDAIDHEFNELMAWMK